MAEEGKFSTLLKHATDAELADTLSTGGNFTIFAPTDEAFEKMKEGSDEEEMDIETLKNILLYHVLPDIVYSTDLENDMTAETLEGNSIRVNIYLRSEYYPGFVTINGVRISKADLEATNGVIHVITDVLMPTEKNIIEILRNDDRFTTLLTALEKADLIETMEGNTSTFTLFAPTDDAFAKIPEETLNTILEDKEALTSILLRHVIPESVFQKGISWKLHETAGGEKIQTQVFKQGIMKVVSLEGGARIEEADHVATNGVVHVIDSVI